MLYVFHVDAGMMYTYSMALTLQSVSSLKIAIEKRTKVPANGMVLLVSGGEVLESDHKVSSYSAGTDTNPIYMFSKPSLKDSNMKQSTQYSVCDLSPIGELSTDHWRSASRTGNDLKTMVDLEQKVKLCYTLPPAVRTVVRCAALAQQFNELGHEISGACEQLVHDQHLQHQGWSAVVANLEDIFHEFSERSKHFKESFKKHRAKKDFYHDQLNALSEVLESLGRIPILPALKQNAEAHRFSAFDVYEEAAAEFEGQCVGMGATSDNSSEHRTEKDFGVEPFKMSEEDVFDPQKQSDTKTSMEEGAKLEDSDEGVTFKAQSYESKEEPTLLHWILAQGNKASLQDILDYCQKGLSLIEEDPLKERETELYHILEYANMHGLKQIKGIEDRLFGLDQLLSDVKKLERDQHDQAQSLIQNRDRVSTGCDASVLPMLVQSHRCQLEKLLKNHQELVDIKRRISRSKEELSHIIKARLEAVLMIENSMSVQDAHQMLSFQCFNRLARYFDIVEQLHQAPSIFVHAVNEVSRRKSFSDTFLKWATDLAENLLKIHDEEVSRRQEFNVKFHGHFLNSLFPGMAELPPPFAIQAPPTFDDKIPSLTDEDLEFVTNAFPDLVKDVPKFDMEATINFFRQRFTPNSHEDKDTNVPADLENLDSEIEAGDFERLSRQSTTEKQKVDISTICVPETTTVSMVTEDNMDTHRINMDKLKDFINQLFELCRVNIYFIREELAKLKQDMEEQKLFFANNYAELLKSWEQANEQSVLEFREQTQRLTVDFELEISDLKRELVSKNEIIDNKSREVDDIKKEHQKEIERLTDDNKSTQEVLEKCRAEVKSFDSRLEEIEVQKQKEIKEMQEKMHIDYKAEIESLRSRFRLVALTNMDRSPSESSLEKIERTDVIEISSHNAIVMQTKENAEVEKEEAVRKIREESEKEWRQKLDEELASLKAKYESEKQVTLNDSTRRLLAEKDRQLELLREREVNLVRECSKYKETIQQLTDPETNDIEGVLKSKCNNLEVENEILKKQLEELKRDIEKIEECKQKEEESESRSSPKKEESRQRVKVLSHTPCGLPSGTVSIASCLPGNNVLVVWDPTHENYTVFQYTNDSQESANLYFVHSDSLPALDLSIQVRNESDRRLYAIGTVESKEYCYAKKSDNRYRMPRGARFYRVRLKPYKFSSQLQCCEPKLKTEKADKRDCLKGSSLAAMCDKRPVKKWLTYMHAPDSQKSVDTSQSTSSATDEPKVEVVIGTLINLESPVKSETVAEEPEPPSVPAEDQLDSVEAARNLATSRMQASSLSTVTDMECSVGRVLELPPELTVSVVSVQSRATNVVPPDSELAEEATP